MIIKEMETGLNPIQKKKTISITDRKEAIRTACMMAQEGDIILIAGKGHETYQEIKGTKYPFDDKSILAITLKELEK
jgi:UDP-N-acetylmuramoyl-L-alanyl-D-glutamate--2,6-diaminopimelate ligase